jgi:hypothetical protein
MKVPYWGPTDDTLHRKKFSSLGHRTEFSRHGDLASVVCAPLSWTSPPSKCLYSRTTSTVMSLFNSPAVWRTVTCLLDGFRLDGEHQDCCNLTPCNLVTAASGLHCLRLHGTRGLFVLLQWRMNPCCPMKRRSVLRNWTEPRLRRLSFNHLQCSLDALMLWTQYFPKKTYRNVTVLFLTSRLPLCP